MLVVQVPVEELLNEALVPSLSGAATLIGVAVDFSGVDSIRMLLWGAGKQRRRR